MKKRFLSLLVLAMLLPAPWGAAVRSEPVTICVLDTGCNLSEAEGRNFLSASTDLSDPVGHGTDICTLLRDGAPSARVLMLKCAGEDAVPDEEAAVQALYAAVDTYGADIITISWTVNQEREDLLEAVRYASDAGAILVASAGNLSFATGVGSDVYPAAWDEVIGVAGVNLDEEGKPESSLWYLSSEAVYVCARADAGTEKGSSYAVPRVAAAIAVYLEDAPDATLEEVRQMLRDTARDLGPAGYDTTYGWGYIESDI